MRFAKTLAAAVSVATLAGSMFASTAFAADAGMAAPTKMMKPVVDIACMTTAVDKREDAIASANSTFTSAWSSAYAARKTALDAAWAMTDAKGRRAALKSAWSAYSGSVKGARSAWNTARKSAWSDFKTDGKACHASSMEMESAGSMME